jgi:WD40 repeat protein
VLASCGADSYLRLWDVKTTKALHAWKDREGFLSSVAFSPDGRMVAAGGSSSDGMETCLYDLKRGKFIRKLDAWADGLAFSPDSKVLVAAGGLFGGWRLTFTDIGSGRTLAEETSLRGGHHNTFTSAARSPDGRLIAFGSARGISLWDVAKKTQMRWIEGEFGACINLVFAPDSKLVAAHADGTVLVWDVSEKKE